MRIHKYAFWCSTVLAVLAIYNTCSAQYEDRFDPAGAIRSELEAAVTTRFGPGFVVKFAIMDSLLAHGIDSRRWLGEAVTDPYGTLRGCIFFSARRLFDGYNPAEDSCITGVYKNGQIVWDNSPGSKDGIGRDILTARDINNDGEVEILTASASNVIFWRGEGNHIEYLSILSWNGSRGKFINELSINPDDIFAHDYARSTVISEDGVFETLDSDGDGILEIRGQVGEDWLEEYPNYRTITTPYVTYGWNGSKYGLWPSVRQVPQNEFLPANRLSVFIKCSVLPTDSGFVYSYVVTNSATSKQRIQRFFITGITQLASSFAPASWFGGGSRYLQGRVFYELSMDRMATIAPGESKGGFGAISIGLPAIVRYYVQGLTAGTPFVSDEERRNDILNNSVSGYTLGVVDTTRPSGSADFLDTLSSYTTQSRSLGWITSQPVADKYLGYFASAKAQLQANNTAGARAALQTVLQDVSVDSSTTLTSEAYALLCFNTEYLLTQLPSPPPSYTLTVNVIGSGSVAKNPDQALYGDGSAVQLTATPTLWYWAFGGWGGDTSGSTNPLSLTINGNKTITATFVLIPVSAMIDTLAAMKHRAQANGWLGDHNFVKLLDLHLELAKKALQRGDSLVAAVQVRIFQEEIKRGYQITQLMEKDRRHPLPWFVRKEANDLLVPAAQAVLDRLPRKLPVPGLPVLPVLDCVERNADGTYSAWFGYVNPNQEEVIVEVGAKKRFQPEPEDRGQPTVFLAGRQSKAFSVVFDWREIRWRLNDRTVSGSRNSPRCK